MSDAVLRRRRDPETRRRAIVTAAAELIVEVGVSAVTHRMIAARAEVPLGATTQYFATLDDLRVEALRHLVAEIDQRMDELRTALLARGATPEVLTELIAQGLADARAMEADRAVVTAAVNDPQLRVLARRWSDRLIALLSADHDRDRAKAAAIFIDGVLWHSRIDEEALSPALIRTALAAILGDSTRPSSASD